MQYKRLPCNFKLYDELMEVRHDLSIKNIFSTKLPPANPIMIGELGRIHIYGMIAAYVDYSDGMIFSNNEKCYMLRIDSLSCSTGPAIVYL